MTPKSKWQSIIEVYVLFMLHFSGRLPGVHRGTQSEILYQLLHTPSGTHGILNPVVRQRDWRSIFELLLLQKWHSSLPFTISLGQKQSHVPVWPKGGSEVQSSMCSVGEENIHQGKLTKPSKMNSSRDSIICILLENMEIDTKTC